MKRLRIEEWKNVYNNLNEDEEIEILWLDGTDEYVLCIDYELFEDGFKSENEAFDRLMYVESKI